MDDSAEDASVTGVACAGEPADTAPTEQQCELQEGDMSKEFKTQGANVPVCNAEKHNVQSTELESDSVYIDIADKLLVKEELKILISGEYCSPTLPNR